MVVEIAPHPGIHARLGGDADGVQLQGEQSDADLKFHTGAHAHRAHDVEVKVIVRCHQVRRAVRDRAAEELERERVALGSLILKAHAERDVQVDADHKVGADAVNKDMELVNRTFLGVDLLAEQLDPVLLGVLHHGGVFIRQTAADGVHINILAEEVLFIFHQLLDLLAEVDGSALKALQWVGVVLVFLGAGGGNDADARVKPKIQVGVELIIRDIREDPRLFPHRTAAGVDAEQDLLLECRTHLDDELAVGHAVALDLHRKAQGQLGAQTVFAVKVRQRAGVDLRLDLEVVLVQNGGAAAAQQRGRALLHGRAVVIRRAVYGQPHVVAQLLEAVGLHRKIGQILRRLLREAALTRLPHHVGLHLRDLALRQFRNIRLAGGKHVHRREDLVLCGAVVGQDVVIALDRDVCNFAIARRRGGCAERAAVKQQEVARVDARLGAETHRRIFVVGEIQLGLRHARPALALVLRLYRQNVRRKQDVLRVGGAVAVRRAVDARNFHIGDRVVLSFGAQVGAHAGVDRDRVAHGNAAAGICKRAALRDPFDARGRAVSRQRGAEQTVQRAQPADLALFDVFKTRVQPELVHLALVGDDVQHAHALRLRHAADHKAALKILRQLHTVRLPLFQNGCDRAAGNGVAVLDIRVGGPGKFCVVRCHVDERFDAVARIAGDAERVAAHSHRRDIVRHAVGRLRRRHLRDLHCLFAAVEPCVERKVARDKLAAARRVGELRVIIPARKQPLRHIRRGQGGNFRAGGDRLGVRQGHAGGVHAIAQRKRHRIIGRRCRAAGAAAGRGTLHLLDPCELIRRVDAHARGGYARLGIPGVHALVHAHTKRRRLRAAGVALGVKAPARAVEQPCFPELQHRLARPGRDLFQIGRGRCDVRAGVQLHAEQLQIAHKEHHHLLAGDEPVRRELAAARSVGDAVFRRPLHIGRVVGVRRHVGKFRRFGIVCGIDARHTPEDGHKHPAGHRAARREKRLAHTAEEAVHAGILHRGIVPVRLFYVGKRVGILRRLRRGRLRQCAHRQHRQQHRGDQQDAQKPFFHTCSLPDFVIF